MTVRFLKLMLLFSSLLAFTMTMNGQSEGITVHVPFAFQAGGKSLPAGDYRLEAGEASNVLVIEGSHGNSSAFLTMASESAGATEGPSLIFKRDGGTMVLSAVHLPGQQSRVLFANHASMKGGVATVSSPSR
jgi:hypothetical protein